MDSPHETADSALIYAARRSKLKASLVERGLDALLISCPANRFYLSGFELHDPQPNESSGRLLITAYGPDWLATDSRYELAARGLWDAAHIFIYGGDAPADLVRLMARNGDLIGIETTCMTQNFWRRLNRAVCPHPSFVPADGMVEALRVIKDEAEIKALRASFALNHQMLAWLEKDILPLAGKISEKEAAWEIEKFFREHGAAELAFPSIVANGPAAALPHAIPRDQKICANAPLLADVGCRVDNYCSDQTRTWWLGANPAADFTRCMDLVRTAQEAAFEIMRPGVKCADVYRTARQVFINAGVEKAFNHGLGHGVGLETHEAPSLSPRAATVLKKGMAVTVEPGLYFPEWGGIRWENTVLVEENGISIF